LYTQYRFFIERTKACVSPEKALAYTPIHYGDVLFAGSGETIEEIGKSAVNLLTEPACCGGDVILFRPSISVDAKFFGYAADCPQATFQKACMGRGFTVMHIYASELKYLSVALPPLPEQRAIAAFLDAETARIDTLVAKQEALIVTLQEKRRALISHVVTKGINPAAPMKDSGVPWLGAVPAHWEVKRLAKVAYLHRGYDLPADNRTEGSFPVVTSGGIVDTHNDFKARGPGVAMGRYGTTGDIFYIEQDYWPHNTALFVEDFHGNAPRYIFYLLQILPYEAHSGKSAVPGIDRNDLHVLHICEPQRQEQEAIASYLDQETSQIDILIAKAQEMIAVLREHRTALVAAAVTGQIDVRGVRF
jgi:type I restriction enzyme S subunit